MSKVRLSMRKIEEILRLKYEAKLSHRAIAQSCLVSPSTVSEYITHAKAAGLSWPLPEGLSAKQLEELLFPTRAPAAGGSIPQPDWAKVHKELRRKSVTLSLLWVEYRQVHADGYGYSQFCHHYRMWAKQLKPMMRQKHRAGEKLFIDYAGQTVPLSTKKNSRPGWMIQRSRLLMVVRVETRIIPVRGSGTSVRETPRLRRLPDASSCRRSGRECERCASRTSAPPRRRCVADRRRVRRPPDPWRVR